MFHKINRCFYIYQLFRSIEAPRSLFRFDVVVSKICVGMEIRGLFLDYGSPEFRLQFAGLMLFLMYGPWCGVVTLGFPILLRSRALRYRCFNVLGTVFFFSTQSSCHIVLSCTAIFQLLSESNVILYISKTEFRCRSSLPEIWRIHSTFSHMFWSTCMCIRGKCYIIGNTELRIPSQFNQLWIKRLGVYLRSFKYSLL